MKRRNFLREILFFVVAFIFGYSIKVDGDNMVLEEVDSNSNKGTDGKTNTDEIKVMKEQFEDIKRKLTLNVEDFNGSNNVDKIQNAINFSVKNGRCLEFTKLYDITDQGPLTIDKGLGTFYIVGKGGGIIKNDDGYIFDNSFIPSIQRISDINIKGMYFESNVKKTVTNVWNLDCFLRINSSDNTYNGIDSVFRTDHKLAQSIRFSRESIRGGNNYAFYALKMIDVTISECLIEDRNIGWGYSGGGIANTVSSSVSPDKTSNFNIRIENNVIEGMDLCGVKLGNCIASKISGNYMEANNGYYDLWSLVDDNTYTHSLEFSSNHTQQTAQQVKDKIPALKIRNIISMSKKYKQKSSALFSNNRALGVLYETNSFINSIGDHTDGPAICIPIDKIILIGGQNRLPEDADSGVLATIISGTAYGYFKTKMVVLNANEQKLIHIDVINAYFDNPITDNSVVSVTTNDITNVIVISYNWEFKSQNTATVNIVLKNVASYKVSPVIKINVINLGD
ncbi:hypothetical protein BKC07_04465 [Peribacillus simplex]|nr:hypothetical protein BKC07_04465 [Peribacillus simplex]